METASDLCSKIVEKFATRDVYEIAEKCGVKIVYEKWFPVTFGEFDYRAKTICVNENAEIDAEKIIAHELGHFFVREFDLKITGEEKFCDEFAAGLMKNCES